MAGVSSAEAADGRGRGVAWLVAAQAPEGSWGYRPGGTGYVEPTALAVLALLWDQAPAQDILGSASRALEWLRKLQRPNGSWGICPLDDSPSWMTACAVWAFSRAERALGEAALRPSLDTALGWLLAETTSPLSSEDVARTRETLRIDGTLVGWPWVVGDAHWVFPTALSVLASSVAGRASAPRVRQGVAFLLDRACEGGGWNVGNPYMLDKSYAPTIADTAMALLALKAAGEDSSPQVRAGVAKLRELVAASRTAVGLAWGALALRSHGDDPTEARTRLLRLQAPDGAWQRNPFATALSILALDGKPAV